MTESINARYQRAQTYLQAANGGQHLVLNATVAPHWLGESDCFWYKREYQNKQGSGVAQQYRLVNAIEQTNELAFDHAGLAEALSTASGETVSAENLPLQNIEFDIAKQTVRFNAFGFRWQFNSQVALCEKLEALLPDEIAAGKASPDGRYFAFTRDNNLWLYDTETKQERALTTDGNELYRYGGSVSAGGNELGALQDFLWSPDSTRLLTQRIDTREVGLAMPLVEHVPEDGSVRPRLLRPNRRVAMQSDEQVEAWQLLSIEITSGHIQPMDCDPCPMTYPYYLGYFCAGRGWWDIDSRHAYCIVQESSGSDTRVLKCDTHNGEVAVLFKEPLDTDQTYTLIPATHMAPPVMPLPESHEIIWLTEQSGWPQLVLRDMNTGDIKNTMTTGDWVVRNLIYFHAQRRELLIQTAGRYPASEGDKRNPYYCDVCWVNIDTGSLRPVIHSDHEYTLFDQQTFFALCHPEGADAFCVSPSGQYVVATRSRVDQAPVTLLVNHEGAQCQIIEAADISGLPQHWQWPEPIKAIADNGQTELGGVLFKPSDFSADKSYPVLDLSVDYFSVPAGAFCNNFMGDSVYYYGAAYAELGFIVVMINNRGEGLTGGAGLRDRAFNHHRDMQLPRHNRADSVAAIQYLAARRPYMDIDRVGISDYVSLPSAVTGLLVYPDFFKVGVSVNPAIDDALFPAIETHVKGLPQCEDLAHRLRGKLLLIHGMLDDAILVSATFRMVEAFKQANKTFDMLLLPNGRHGMDAYATRRGWDYLVEHLLGETPPENFSLSFLP